MVAQGVSQVASFLLDIVDTVVHGFARLVSFITDTVVPALLGVFKPPAIFLLSVTPSTR